MSPEDLAYSLKVEAAKAAVSEAEKYLGTLITGCKHVLPPLTDEMKHVLKTKPWEAWGGYDSAFCVVCEANFGWRCPTSPDGACHYFSMHGRPGFVRLIDDSEVPVPADHDIDYETDDDCMFCHQPEERK
jgi:hypothetical protein